MSYTVIDTWAGQHFPADTKADVQQAVEFILSGNDLTSREDEELTWLLYNVSQHGAAFSRILGVEVIPHD